MGEISESPMERLIGILRCPATGQALRLLPPEEVARFGEALLREDGLVAYPIQSGIPLLVASAAFEPKKPG
jgi:uncharacterized protein YbaR (Trm112 family)